MSLPTSLALSKDNYLFASGGRDKVINFYELRTYKLLKTVAVLDAVEGIVWLNAEQSNLVDPSASTSTASSQHTLVVAAGSSLRLFRVVFEGNAVSSFCCEALYVLDLFSTPAVELVDTCPMGDGAIKGTSVVPFTAQTSIVSLHYCEKAAQLVVASSEHNLHSYSLRAPTPELPGRLAFSRQLVGSCGDILDLAILPESSPFVLAMASNSSQVRLLDKHLQSVPLIGHSDIVLSVVACPESDWLITSSKDGTCRVWSLSLQRCCGLLQGHTDAVSTLAVSCRPASYTAHSAAIYSAGADKILKRTQFPSQQLAAIKIRSSNQRPLLLRMQATNSVRAHDKDISSLAVSPNDSVLASGSQDRTVKLWAADSLQLLATLTGHKRGVWKVLFSPVDKVLASSSGDRTVRLWSAVDYSCVRTFEGHTGSVLALQFVNRGMQLLSGSADGLLRLWTLRSGECQGAFEGHSDRVWAAVAVAAGRLAEGEACLVSGGSDSKLVLWEDCTVREERERVEALEQEQLAEQQLLLDLHHKRYAKALSAALALGHAGRVLTALTALLDEEGPTALNPLVGGWDDAVLGKLMGFVAHWNTDARNAFVCSRVLQSLLQRRGVQKLLSLHTAVTPDLLASLIAYTTRHYARVSRLVSGTYISDSILSSMELNAMPDQESGKLLSDEGAGSWAAVGREQDRAAAVAVPVIFKPKEAKKRGKKRVLEAATDLSD